MTTNVKKILSLDGGGIRGLAQLSYLEEFEKRTGKQCHEIFDVIVGTSTGGFIALLLSIPGIDGKVRTAQEAKEIYLKNAKRIFPKHRLTPLVLAILFVLYIITIIVLRHDTNFFMFAGGDPAWLWVLRCLFFASIIAYAYHTLRRISKYLFLAQYSEKGLLDVLAENYKDTTTLKDAVRTNVGVVVTDMRYRRSIVLNSWRAKMYHEGEDNDYRHNVTIANAARATSAAPTYFKPVNLKGPNSLGGDNSPRWYSRDKPNYRRGEIDLEDGGTSSNNPARLAMIYARNIVKCEGNPDDYQYLLLSIGTGTVTGAQDDPTDNLSQSFLEKWFKCAKLDGGMDNVINRLLLKDAFSVSLNAYHTHTRMLDRFGGEGPGYAYYRAQFRVTESQLEHMDDSSNKNMEKLVKSGQDIVSENAYHFNEMVNLFTTGVVRTSIAGRQAELPAMPQTLEKSYAPETLLTNDDELKEPLMPYKVSYNDEMIN